MIIIAGMPGRDGLPGLPGRDGEDGSLGIQGVQGIKGDQGENGHNGMDGQQGLRGLQQGPQDHLELPANKDHMEFEERKAQQLWADLFTQGGDTNHVAAIPWGFMKVRL